ncbi:MAG: DEAD/DEAH box helicase [Brevefilum sp.]|nr:DEAD/DEAH box helicase [Brevefilum sp.]
MNFNNFAFHPHINAGISKVGYVTPTPIQARTIPPILAGSDVLGLAQTGTGKTAAFVLPMLQRLMTGQRGKLRALILAPTRELAEQTHVAIKELGGQTGLRSISIYGGVSTVQQKNRLRTGVDIVVACPGRLLDLKNQGAIDLRNIEILVLDEADHMFDMGFLPDVKRIISAIPEKRQTLLFSATMPAKVHELVTKIMDHPVTIEIDIAKPIDAIDHAIYPVDQVQKLDMLLYLLGEHRSNQVLVFTRTKRRASKLAVQLSQAGVSSTSIQGNLSQSQRQKAMNAFRKGKIKVLVATDIAARGIDVMEVSHVINFDVPDTADAYTHRTGRTGRMDQTGTAFSLVTQEDLPMVHAIERTMGKSLERRRVNGFDTILKESKKNNTVHKNSRMSRSKNRSHYQPSAKHS